MRNAAARPLSQFLNVSPLRMQCKTVLRHRFESVPQCLPTEEAMQNVAAIRFKSVPQHLLTESKMLPRHCFESIPHCLPNVAVQNGAATPF